MSVNCNARRSSHTGMLAQPGPAACHTTILSRTFLLPLLLDVHPDFRAYAGCLLCVL
jgi:hypothetical protein